MRVDKRLESWRALEDILRSGRARAIGVSNYGVHHLEELFANCRVRPAVNQVGSFSIIGLPLLCYRRVASCGRQEKTAEVSAKIEIHPWCTRTELVSYCQRNGVAVEAYSPLTKGRRLHDPVLAAVRPRSLPSDCQARDAAPGYWLIADVYKKSPAQVLIRWSIQKGHIVLPKSVTPARISTNAQVPTFATRLLNDGQFSDGGLLDGRGGSYTLLPLVYDFELAQVDMAKLDVLNEDYITGWDPTSGP
eukprot:SM001640S02285  [mRNA]  locus=s1640:977:1827:- [translate_table: standard]